MKIGFVGAGKVGFSLGKFFCVNGVQVTGYYSKHLESAMEAAEFTETNCYEEMETLVKDSDVLFLTVPDGEIQGVYNQLKAYDIIEKQICHCSGAMSAKEAFPDVESYRAFAYSIHPLFPVSSKLTSYRELSGAFFCLEGSKEHLTEWEEFFGRTCKGGKIIDGSSKVKYHAACAIASNLYCGLMKLSLELLNECGFSEQDALRALKPLVESNVKHLLEDGPVNALTGPVERGDRDTVKKHIECLENQRDREMYLGVTRKLIQVAEEKNPSRSYESLMCLMREKY